MPSRIEGALQGVKHATWTCKHGGEHDAGHDHEPEHRETDSSARPSDRACQCAPDEGGRPESTRGIHPCSSQRAAIARRFFRPACTSPAA